MEADEVLQIAASAWGVDITGVTIQRMQVSGWRGAEIDIPFECLCLHRESTLCLSLLPRRAL